MLKTELLGTIQYVTDDTGIRKAVLLDLDIWQKILQILPDSLEADIEIIENHSIDISQAEAELQRKIAEIRDAPNDPLFMADLEDTMSDFVHIDAEWWERNK